MNPVIEPEFDIVKGTATYESTSGAANFVITTVAPPQEEVGGELNEVELQAALFTATSSEELGPAAKAISGTATTLSATYAAAANRPFNCVAIFAPEGTSPPMVFPLAAPPTPPAPPAPTPPAPAPAILSIAKAKALTLKVGKSKTVKVKVTNTGATATVQGSLRVKPVKGVLIRPEVQKLPVLAPGASWSVTVRVQLTAKAKKKSTLSLTGTAAGATTAPPWSSS